MSETTTTAYPTAFDGKVALQFFAAAVDTCIELQKPGTAGATPWEMLAMFDRHVTPEVAADLILTGRQIDRPARKSVWQIIRGWLVFRRLDQAGGRA